MTKGIPATWYVSIVIVWGTKQSQCPMLKTNGPHKTVAMQQTNMNHQAENSAQISVMTPMEKVK